MYLLERFAMRLLLLPALMLLVAVDSSSVVAQSNCVPATNQQLIIYHAGSLSAAFTPVEQAFTC